MSAPGAARQEDLDDPALDLMAVVTGELRQKLTEYAGRSVPSVPSVPSALRASGSTRRWRTLVAFVLERDRRRCRMLRDGHVCNAYATTGQHVIPRWAGGTDDLRNVIAACASCNYSERHRPPPAGPGPAGLTARQAAVVELLDTYGLPCTGGRRQARALLTRWAVPLRASGVDLDTACAWRRARGPLTRI